MRNMAWIVPASLLVFFTGCGTTAAVPFKPMADTALLMNAVIDPASDVVWGSVGWVITSAGEEQFNPKTDEEWLAVRNGAVQIAESGNLLMMAPRAKDDEWIRISQALVDTGTEAMKAADARDVEALFRIGGDIYAVCTNCHSKYSPDIVRVD